MNAKKINTLFKHPEEITSEDLIGLKQAVDDFPYAAPLHALYMKALQKKESYLLPGQIKRAAIATPNRAALKEFHDMPIPGMESAKKVPVVDFTEVAEAGKVEDVEVAAEAPEIETTSEKKAEPEKKAMEPVKAEAPVQTKVEKAPEAAVQTSEPAKPEPEVKEPVKVDTPKPKAAPAKPTPVTEDLSHLPEAVRKAILRSRSLRGEETPASATEEKKPVEVAAPKLKQPPAEMPAEPIKQVEDPKAAEVVEPVQTAPVKKTVPPARVDEKPAEEKPVQEKFKPVQKKPAAEAKPMEEKLAPEKPAPALEKTTSEKPKKAPKAPKPKQSMPKNTKAAPVEEKLEVREMPFSEKASFMEWLTADFSDGEPKKVERSAPKDVKTIISELPKFPQPKKDGKIDVFHLTSDDQGKFVTETLAEIYLKQALWDKAINAYEVLSLKYPEKSGFFADRIREIKKQKK